MSSKLPIYDARMLELMDYCISNKKVGNKKEFCDSIGITVTNLYKIKPRSKKGEIVRSFTVDQMIKAATIYNVSMDWIAGFTNQMSRKPVQDPMEMLEQAVQAIKKQIS